MPDPTQHTTTLQWLASLYKIMGKEKADKLHSRSWRHQAAPGGILCARPPSACRPAKRRSRISLIRYTVTYSEKGAPVDYVRLGKMLSTGQYLSPQQ